MPRWTFLSNYGLVLSYIALHPHSTAREIANAVGITERTARTIIADLNVEGFIVKIKQGRCNSYDINPNLVLRHPAHNEVAVGELLRALGWKRKIKRRRVGFSGSKPHLTPDTELEKTLVSE